LLIAGIILLVGGIADYVVAGVLARSGSAATGGLAAEPNPAVVILRRAGVAAVLVGVVLIVAGLAT
jgi:hypothetical protein